MSKYATGCGDQVSPFHELSKSQPWQWPWLPWHHRRQWCDARGEAGHQTGKYQIVFCCNMHTQDSQDTALCWRHVLSSHASARTFRLHSASSINPEDGTISRTYDPRYQIILAVRTKKWENGFLNKSRLLLF